MQPFRSDRLHRSARQLALVVGFTLLLAACAPAQASVNPPTAIPEVEAGAATEPTPSPETAPTATPEPTPVPTAFPTPAPTSTPPPASRDARLRQSIESVISKLNGDWGVGVLDLSTGEALLIGADPPYPAASQYKLLLLAEAYRLIEAGQLSPDQMTTMLQSDYVESLLWDEELKPGDRVSVRGLIRVMVIQSSNAAAHALTRVMGGSITPTVNASAARLGLDMTRMPGGQSRSGDWRDQQAATSVQDLMRFYELAYRGQLVSKAASQAMLDVLKDQQINDRIPARLPSRVEVAHKTGNLPGAVNDAGIVFGPRQDFVLVVLSHGADYEQGTEAIGRIGALVYEWFNS